MFDRSHKIQAFSSSHPCIKYICRTGRVCGAATHCEQKASSMSKSSPKILNKGRAVFNESCCLPRLERINSGKSSVCLN